MLEKSITLFSIWLCNNLDWKEQATIDKVNYGLLCLSYNLIKTFIFILLSLLFGFFPYIIVFLFAYGILRFLSFGVHMSSPISCSLFSGGTIFICIAIAIYIDIPNIITYLLLLCSLLSYWIYAPAYMKNKVKRNHHKRKQLRIYTFLFASTFCIIGLLLDNVVYSRVLYLSCLLQAIMILPITFKLMGKEVEV